MVCDKEGWHLMEWTPPCSHIVCSINDYVISERSVRGHNYGDPRTRCTCQVCEGRGGGGGGGGGGGTARIQPQQCQCILAVKQDVVGGDSG